MRVADPTRAKRDQKQSSHRQLETKGLIVIAILILAITVLRYWHNIHWSTR